VTQQLEEERASLARSVGIIDLHTSALNTHTVTGDTSDQHQHRQDLKPSLLLYPELASEDVELGDV
jgi:hypothetical protein